MPSLGAERHELSAWNRAVPSIVAWSGLRRQGVPLNSPVAWSDALVLISLRGTFP